jgi:putative transcriptional regulator
MTKTKVRYRSEALAAAHKTAKGLHRIGVIDGGTMREFDASCLTTVEELSPKAIQSIRERAGVSQAVFASFLNVKAKLVSEWERGEKKPSGPSLKLLTLVKSKGLEAIS